MTKKHFNAIAAVLANLRDTQPSQGRDIGEEVVDSIAYELSLLFRGWNGQFDQDRFLRACHTNLENVL